jgi:hypothetical protein
MERLYRHRVLAVLKHVQAHHQKSGPPYDLDVVREAIMAGAHLDSLVFEPFEPNGDGILGRYELSYESEGPYAQATKLHARVCYASTENVCWRRFIICKEMCHIFWNDEPHFQSANAAVLMAVVGNLTGSNQVPAAMAPAILTEQAAVVAALDILFPLEDRIKAFEDHTGSRKVPTIAIARRYRIPEYYVIESLHPNFLEMSKHFWKKR